MGGVARRATMMAEVQRKNPQIPTIVLEAGFAMKQADDLNDPGSLWAHEALEELGVHAVHTTPADLIRLDHLAQSGKIAGESSCAYVASDLERSDRMHFPLVPYAVRNVRAAQEGAEVRVGILALSEPSTDARLPARSVGADEALRRILPEVTAKSDVVILLARLPDAELTRIAGAYPDIDAIINGSSKGEGRNLGRIGATPVVEAAHSGISLGTLKLEWDSAGRIRQSIAEQIPLFPMIPESPRLAALIAKSRRKANEFAREEARKSPPVAAPSIFAGSKACRECHEEDHKVWAASRHARAVESLKPTGDEFNRKCLSCHVTAFEANRGFVNMVRTPELGNVHCEACHGAASEHARSPQTAHPGIGLMQGFRKKVRKEFCLRCHDPENSPGFNFDTYWAKIAH